MVNHPVPAILNFYQAPSNNEPPEFRVIASNGTGIKNYSQMKMEVSIRDIRGKEADFNIDKHSFAAIQIPDLSSMDLNTDKAIKDQYHPRVEKLILDFVPGAQSVFIFDHCVRKISNDKSQQSPVRKVHTDQTPCAALMRVERHSPKQIQKHIAITHQRVRIINVWRPLRGPVIDHPLAFAESATVADEDLIPVAHRYEDRVGETFAVKYNPNQIFWYWSHMNVDEVLLLQCFDSAGRGDGRSSSRCAHASFSLPGERINDRERIEVRCIVVGG